MSRAGRRPEPPASARPPADAPRVASALLVDFGGVLTTDVRTSFRAFSAAVGAEPSLVERLLAEDPESTRLLVAHERGEIDDEGFEVGFARRLTRLGTPTSPERLLERLLAGLAPDEEMLGAVARLRGRGVPVAIVSNQLGRGLYAGWDLDAIADVVVLSNMVGVRKPSRRIYAIACERLGRPPDRSVLVDDLEHNLVGAARIGIHGVLHTSAAATAEALGALRWEP